MSDTASDLPALVRRRDAIREQLARSGEVRPGSLMAR